MPGYGYSPVYFNFLIFFVFMLINMKHSLMNNLPGERLVLNPFFLFAGEIHFHEKKNQFTVLAKPCSKLFGR
jgi:hypothetical protein